MKVKLYGFDGLTIGLFPFPFMNRVLSRLHQQRISALNLHRLEFAIREHYGLQLDRSTQIQVTRYQWIHRNHFVGYLARRWHLLRKSRIDRETEQKTGEH